MNAVTYSDLRNHLKEHMDQVFETHEPLIITRKNRENCVLISIDDYNAMKETQYLLSTEANAKRLQSSLDHARAGEISKKELVES
ncbi:MAG: type II toxin-antitoxin system prevent-host-death family antitoxin [candidate division KSB1 bacterium]|nr:type II toxin-antitoxin system prevent-host-death family antitoxin [candidate division KSB1 bacterium]